MNSYVRAANKPVPDAHPDRLRALGLLRGLAPRSSDHCRLLELGCGEGIQLLALGLALPESSFVGIDLDAQAIARGKELADELGVKNVTLQARDVRDLAASEGPFDYVIGHGLYSWVGDDVRTTLLDACRSLLAEQGLGFLSFNTLPGGYHRQMARELLQLNVGDVAAPLERIARARAVATDFTRALSDKDPPQSALRNELLHVLRASDSLIALEYLGPESTAFSLRDFDARLSRHGLRYLADAATFDLSPAAPRWLAERLGPGAAPIDEQQHLDYLTLRRFRQAVFCRADASPTGVAFERAGELAVFASVAPVTKPSAGAMKFRTLAGLELEVTNETLKLALSELGGRWPCGVRLAELARLVSMRTSTEVAPPELARLLFVNGLGRSVFASAESPRCTREPGAKPLATPLARLQARLGEPVTNQHHVHVDVEPAFNRHLLSLLDGTLDRAGLSSRMGDAIEQGTVAIAGVDPSARAQLRQQIAREMDACLAKLARFGLIVA
jgi:trans-aconitate methyltransferase